MRESETSEDIREPEWALVYPRNFYAPVMLHVKFGSIGSFLDLRVSV